MSHKGNFEQVLHIFAYLKKHHNFEMVFYPSDTVVDDVNDEHKDWTSSEFDHEQVQRELPPNII